MDSFTERMLERAKARQKKLEEHFHISNEARKTPLQEPNTILQKYDNPSGLTKSQPNLSECNKLPHKETASDSNLNLKTHLYDSSMKENLSDSNLFKKSMTRVSSDLQIHPQSPTKTLNIQKENFNMEIKLTSADNVRVEVEIEERDESEPEEDDESDVQDKPNIRPDVKNRLQRLGKLYSGADEIQLSSPISRTVEKFCEEEIDKDAKEKTPAGLGRLKALASTRNQWEDEVSASNNKSTTMKETPKKSWKPPAPKPPTLATVFTHSPNKGPAPQPPKNVVISKIPSRDSSPEKNCKNVKNGGESSSVSWDNSVLASLESQGFTRTNSNTRLVYTYKNGELYEEKDDARPLSEEESQHLEDVKEEDEIVEEPLQSVSKISKLTSKFFSSKSADKTPSSPSKSNLRTGDVLSKAAKFENQQLLSPTKSKDPALMSVSERKALFEKNKGVALVPKAAFGMAAPLKNVEKDSCVAASTKSLSCNKLSPSPNKTASISCATSPTKSYIAESGGIASKMKALLERKTTISQSSIVNSIQEQRQKDLDLLLNRFQKNKDEGEENDEQSSGEDEGSEEDEIISETTKMLPDRSAKIVQFKEKEIPPPPPPPVPMTKPGGAKRRSKGDSPKVREVLEDVKRIRVSPPKAGRMYPCLSDIEASTENEQEATTAEPSPDTSYDENCSVDSDEPNTSFGREILQVVTKNQTPQQKRPSFNDSTASELSDILDGMDDYLDEAMGHDDDSDCCEGPTPPKQGRSIPPVSSKTASSSSFHFSKGFAASKYPSPAKKTPTKSEYSPKKSSELPTHVVEGENLIPLTHTVSFYRKQQAQGSRTAVRQITRQPILTEEESPNKEEADNSLEVSEKIQDLMNTVTKQQTVISQASQALNLCCSTIEFSGSSEQVEAERLLLVATQRRQAALYEVQRLRVEGTLHLGGDASVDKGILSLSEITLPLKKEYVRALSAAGGQGHHIVCLIKNAENVIPTRLVSTFASPKDAPELKLRIPGTIKLENIYSDFTVTVEVYSLQAQEELLPHDVKYHINVKKSGNKLTPKKKNDSKLIMPTVQSPAGPQAVRSPSFALVGYVVFSLQGLNRKQWTLNNAPAMSPLEGTIQMNVHCQMTVSVEHRGFLTMFDDISGFGAWHRRWCLLKGHSLSYWRYPDDEKKKAPIDSINIQICSTKKIGLVSRDICARPNTFLLETVRSAKSNDKDSLVTVRRGDKTIIRHLLSADTKEERLEWCEKFNKALDSIRLWKNN